MTNLSWIGIFVRSNNQGFLNAITNMIPSRVDSRLWDSDQYTLIQDQEEDGTNFLYISLFFLDSSERESFKGSLYGIGGFLNAGLPGSFLKTSKCWHHDIQSNGSPSQSDQIEYEEVII